MSWVARLSTNLQEVKFIFNPHVTAHSGATYVLHLTFLHQVLFTVFFPYMQNFYPEQLQANQDAESSIAVHGARASGGHQIDDDVPIWYA
jgi:hypothetical protein